MRYSYKRIHIILKREGIHVNQKRAYRLYCIDRLQLQPKRPRRNVSGAHRKRDYILSTRPKETWAMDFVAAILTRLCRELGVLQHIHCDNGSECAGHMAGLWECTNKVKLEFSRPRTPTENEYIESFNGSFRGECLNRHSKLGGMTITKSTSSCSKQPATFAVCGVP